MIHKANNLVSESMSKLKSPQLDSLSWRERKREREILTNRIKIKGEKLATDIKKYKYKRL